MDDLIKALTIFRKYMDGDHSYPTACEHDTLYVNCDPEKVSDEDKAIFEEFGFYPDQELEDIMDKFTSLKTEYSFQLTLDQIAELPKFFGFQKMYDRAQSMLDEIKGDLKEFYQTNPPRNRKKRRERAKVLKRKIERFNSYCKDRGIKIIPKKLHK